LPSSLADDNARKRRYMHGTTAVNVILSLSNARKLIPGRSRELLWTRPGVHETIRKELS